MQNTCREGADFSKEELSGLLASGGEDERHLLAEAVRVRNLAVGEGIYLRGLIEYSNVCRKNCLYCGIARGMECERYTLTHDQVMEAVEYAVRHEYGSVVLQGGENTSSGHVSAIENILEEITSRWGGSVGVTISFGEQSPETYRRWLAAGAHRYLLRVESSNPALYARLHPDDGMHGFETRIKALRDLRETGYMVGTGVMIGIPGQTPEDLAGDLLFMKELDIDMCGMGPYVESRGTPLSAVNPGYGGEGQSGTDAGNDMRIPADRLRMTLRMTALLRLMMPDINIAAATALEAIDPRGRALAVEAGANVIMLNVTPEELKPNYSLYDNKPFAPAHTPLAGEIRFGEKGDPARFRKRCDRGGRR